MKTIKISYRKKRLGRSWASIDESKITIKKAEELIAGMVPNSIIRGNENDTLIYIINSSPI